VRGADTRLLYSPRRLAQSQNYTPNAAGREPVPIPTLFKSQNPAGEIMLPAGFLLLGRERRHLTKLAFPSPFMLARYQRAVGSIPDSTL